MIMSLKQRKMEKKIKPGIKLNHNICVINFEGGSFEHVLLNLY